jgi:copper(I)-binding protein
MTIESPWTRATPGGARVAGGYVKITNNGKQPDRLIAGKFAPAAQVEVHEMSMTDGMMKMRPLPNGVEIKPGETVELKPGGYHFMFMGLKAPLTAGQTVSGTLTFEKAGSVDVTFQVAPLGARSPGEAHHH